MRTITYDSHTGNLVEGLIWEFSIEASLEAAMEYDFVYGEWNGHEKIEKLHHCPISRKHKTGTRWLEVEIDLFGGPGLGDFLPLVNHGFNIVANKFSQRLQESDLTGFSIRDGVKIAENQSSIVDPEFFFLDVTGIGGVCRRWQVNNAPNFCPYCGIEPIICTGCGWCSEYGCPNCGEKIDYYRPSDDDGKRLLYEGYPDTLIVNGKDWDGKDCFAVTGHGGSWFMNRRAKKWVEDNQIVDILFKTAFLDVDGISELLPDGTRI